MSILTIPITPELLNYRFRIDLDGTTYTLAIRYNTRENRWFLDVATAAGVLILSGIKVLLNVNLIERFAQSELPPGNLFILNSDEDSEVEPGLLDFGVNTLLLYEEAI